jgi:predicted short-subunit dehydrogenase-like oxidoreductase (DUF2520 family)
MGSISNIVIIGAGNVGSHLALELHAAGYNISQVAGRKGGNVRELSSEVDASFTLDFGKVSAGQDLYILALPDQVMEEVLPKLPLTDELIVHTSGSVPMSLLKPYSDNTGVLYPLQTFTRKSMVELKEVPVFIEASNPDNEKRLEEMAKKLSRRVLKADSVTRQYVHIAAVFASNFSNHMYDIAHSILEEHGLEFELLVPLIRETAAKAIAIGPDRAQTGPARREDMQIIRKHLEQLKGHEAAAELYKKISESIMNKNKQADDEL